MPVGEISNPILDARVSEKRINEVKERIEFKTTSDKILGILADAPIEVQLAPGAVLKFYPPTDEQFIDIISLQGEGSQISARLKQLGLKPGTTDDEVEDMIPQAVGIINQAKDMLMSVNEILATLSVDKSWTPEQFKRLPKQYKAIIMEAISGTKKKKSTPLKGSRKVPAE